jgi:hypothetical protein
MVYLFLNMIYWGIKILRYWDLFCWDIERIKSEAILIIILLFILFFAFLFALFIPFIPFYYLYLSFLSQIKKKSRIRQNKASSIKV